MPIRHKRPDLQKVLVTILIVTQLVGGVLTIAHELRIF